MMNNKKNALLNISVSLLSQIVTILCGLIAPRLLLAHFGSEIYGATASIAQFLSYIALIEGGIGGVARAALYKPLAEKNIEEINNIVFAVKKYFNVIGKIFIIYVAIIAASFKYISSIKSLDYISTFLLVVIISLSTFAQYFIGISYAVLIQSDKKTYIVSGISTFSVIINTICVVVLVALNCNVLIVKLVSSMVFVLRPVCLAIYAHKKYPLTKKSTGRYIIKDAWTGLGQHIAYFVHSNTDIVLLTLFSSLKNVAIYSVYFLIISNIQSLATSFSAGMEAIFGELFAKKKLDELKATFSKYETLLSVIAIVLFASASILIVPFVRLYTSGITDANYIHPIFALFLILSALIYILRLPYHNMVIAAGHFKQTKFAAYGEAALNILLSVTLIKSFGIVGVAIGTFVATTFRYVFYTIYLSKFILQKTLISTIKRNFVNLSLFVSMAMVGTYITKNIPVTNYFNWILFAIVVSVLTGLITLIVYCCFYRSEVLTLLRKYRKNKI